MERYRTRESSSSHAIACDIFESGSCLDLSLQEGQVRDRDSDSFRELGQGHLAFREHHVEADFNGHDLKIGLDFVIVNKKFMKNIKILKYNIEYWREAPGPGWRRLAHGSLPPGARVRGLLTVGTVSGRGSPVAGISELGCRWCRGRMRLART